MNKPTLPLAQADSSPEASKAMAQYWVDSIKYANYYSNLERKVYHKDYYIKYNADKTKARQLAKLKELIIKYPDETISLYRTNIEQSL